MSRSKFNLGLFFLFNFQCSSTFTFDCLKCHSDIQVKSVNMFEVLHDRNIVNITSIYR